MSGASGPSTAPKAREAIAASAMLGRKASGVGETPSPSSGS